MSYKIKDRIVSNIKNRKDEAFPKIPDKGKIKDIFKDYFEIYDNQNKFVHKVLDEDLKTSERADIAVAFFSAGGWKKIYESLNHYRGEDFSQCRLLLGMYSRNSIKEEWWREDNIQKLVDKFLKYQTEADLKNLINQLKDKKVIIKTVTSYKLHEKLYLFYRKNANNKAPTSCLIGSSNLTPQGLKENLELNIHYKKTTKTEHFLSC